MISLLKLFVIIVCWRVKAKFICLLSIFVFQIERQTILFCFDIPISLFEKEEPSCKGQIFCSFNSTSWTLPWQHNKTGHLKL